MSEEDVFISEGSGSTQGRMGAATDRAEVGGGVHGCVEGDAVMASFEGKLLNQSVTERDHIPTKNTVKGGGWCCTRMFVQTRGGRVCGW